MRQLNLITALSLILLTVSGNVHAQSRPNSSLIDPAFITEVKGWLAAPVTEIAIEAQNLKYGNLSQLQINELDQKWRAERSAELQPLIASILNNPLSTYLTQIQALSGGLFTEVFIMDAKGLNVGQSSITSDFWQGDEAKYQKTFSVASDAVFIDTPEFHDGTKTWRVQLNLTLTNRAGRAIGAATVEVNLTELARREAN